MIQHRKSRKPIVRARAWSRALQQLNESLSRNKRDQADSAREMEEKLARVRHALFGCVGV